MMKNKGKSHDLLEIIGLYFEYYNLGGLNFEINGFFTYYNDSKKTIEVWASEVWEPDWDQKYVKNDVQNDA